MQTDTNTFRRINTQHKGIHQLRMNLILMGNMNMKWMVHILLQFTLGTPSKFKRGYCLKLTGGNNILLKPHLSLDICRKGTGKIYKYKKFRPQK